MNVTPYSIAGNLMAEGGIVEYGHEEDNPAIQWAHMLCDGDDPRTDIPDSLAWCSSLLNLVCHILALPRSRSKMARSWLKIGLEIPLDMAAAGFDVVVFWRGTKDDGVTGHVGLYGAQRKDAILTRAGNQGNQLSDAWIPKRQLIGVRRLA